MHGMLLTLSPYMWYGVAKARFFVFSKQSKGFSSLEELITLRSLCTPLTRRYVLDEHAYSLLDPTDEDIRFVTYYMFEGLEVFIPDYDFP